LIHAEFNRLHRIWKIDRVMLGLVCFNEREQHFKAISVRGSRHRFVIEKSRHLAQGFLVIAFSLDRTNFYLNSPSLRFLRLRHRIPCESQPSPISYPSPSSRRSWYPSRVCPCDSPNRCRPPRPSAASRPNDSRFRLPGKLQGSFRIYRVRL